MIGSDEERSRSGTTAALPEAVMEKEIVFLRSRDRPATLF